MALLGLAACESREEKAERFYQSALTLLEAGDTDRAMVELRNVFQNDGFHRDARQLYADLLIQKGDDAEAYSQLLRLVEQYPDDIAARTTLAEMALETFNWEEVDRHGQAAISARDSGAELPDGLGPRIDALAIAMDYRTAVLNRDDAARTAIAARADALLADHPDLPVARRIVIDSRMDAGDTARALTELDTALTGDPDSYELNMLRLRLLADSNDIDATGDQLKIMVEKFPDDTVVRDALVRWFMVKGDLPGAEAFLRQVAGADDAATEGHMTVVEFLRATQGDEAAIAELDRLATANDGIEGGADRALLYRATRASLDFTAGRQEEAISALTALTTEAEPTDEVRRVRVSLAQMLSATGDRVTARSHVEEVLAQDPNQVEALQLRAAWAIAEDRPAEAIRDLRAAMAQAPRDPNVLMLMAEAHERDGQPELAAERLAAAVEVSAGAPEPSLRYADFLQRSGRASVAESVLLDSRTANPGDVQVASALGQLWLDQREFGRVDALALELENSGAIEAGQLAQRLRAATAFADDRAADGLALLETMAGAGGDRNAVVQLVQAMMADGQLAEARRYLDDERSRAPDDAGLQLLDAALMASEGREPEAESALRDLIAAHPGQVAPVQVMMTLLNRQGRIDDANLVLDEAVAAAPDSAGLLWIQAGQRERGGDIDGAIAIYDSLYERDSSNLIVANNLASLIITYQPEPEDLERAFTIARRLAGSTEPAFQDTYGWLLALRGQPQDAIPYLEGAAAGLAEEPLVHAHLGVALAQAGRVTSAEASLTKARDLAVARQAEAPLVAADEAGLSLANEWLAKIAAGELTEAAPADTAPADVDATEPAPTQSAPEAGAEPADAGPEPAAADPATGGTAPSAEPAPEPEAPDATSSQTAQGASTEPATASDSP